MAVFRKDKYVQIEVIQDALSPGGLRTLQLHSYIQTTKTKRERRLEKLTIGDLKGKVLEDVAKEYLDECERILIYPQTISELIGFVPSEGIAGKNDPTQDKASSLKYAEKISPLERVQVGEARKLAYQGLPVTQEIVFAYKYADYPVYGASARIEIAEEGQLHSATIILPADLQDFKYESSKPIIDIQYIWPILLEEAGYSHIPEEIQKKLKKDYPLEWYFDPKGDGWRLAYIIDNFPKQVEVDKEQRSDDRDGKFSQGWGGMLKLPIFDFVFDAYDKRLIAEI